MLVKPRAGQPAKIKVVGAGGGGGNALSSMIAEGGIPGVEFVAVNTDAQALMANKAPIKIQIGENLTRGLGSGGDPEIGRQAAEESREKLKEELLGADMVFITAGEGGGTGTGSAPIIAEVAKETGALTVAVVTRPFEFEGAKRKTQADDGIFRLKEKVDTLIIVPNQKVLGAVDRKTSIVDAFKKIDSVLHQGVKGIAELITVPGLINVDFADVKTVMSNAGTALMGMGIGSGEKRAMQAIKQAISSPLLDVSIEGAKGILFNVIGGPDLSMGEVDEAASIIAKTVDTDADIIFGAVIDEQLVDQVKITLIATKFDEGKLKLFKFRKNFGTAEVDVRPQTSPSAAAPSPSPSKDDPDSLKAVLDKELDEQIDDYEGKDLIEEDKDGFDIPAFLRKK